MKPEGKSPAFLALGVEPVQKASAFHSVEAIPLSAESLGGKKIQKLLASTTCAIWPYALTLVEIKAVATANKLVTRIATIIKECEGEVEKKKLKEG